MKATIQSLKKWHFTSIFLKTEVFMITVSQSLVDTSLSAKINAILFLIK